MPALSELDMLTNKFVALQQENERPIIYLQQVSGEKGQQYAKLSQRVNEL